jgi:hypothetical protein
MTDGSGISGIRLPLPQDEEPPRDFSANILDALDVDGVGEIDIAFERSPSHPRPATFD